jgi:hypothetical protein
MRQISKKRQKLMAERRLMMEELFGPRDNWRCTFWLYRGTLTGPPTCHGNVNGHELLKRSRGGSITDVGNVVLLCDFHNGWVEDHPAEAHEIGLSLHAWEKS